MRRLAAIPPAVWDLAAGLSGLGLIGAGLWWLWGWGLAALGLGLILLGGAVWSTRRT